MGVVVRRYIYRYPHNNYKFSLYIPLALALFLPAASLLLCSFKNVFRPCIRYTEDLEILAGIKFRLFNFHIV